MQTQMTLEMPPAILSRQRILAVLKKHRVPMEQWGTSTYRSLDDLVNYMTRDRVSFRNGDSKCATIDVHAVVVIVTHQYKGKWRELYEDRQEFTNSKKLLQRKSFNGIAETVGRDETLHKGAERCLAEELGFRDPSRYELSGCLGTEKREPVASEKWPGITAIYHRYFFECIISRELFRRDGYVEIEGNKKIFFKWKPRGQRQFRF